ncbi:MAG: NosD domain-containing protein [Archaeoglobaceae archaeon]
MKRIRTVLAIFILCVLLTSAAGDQITVCESDCNFTQIQSAIISSRDGDVILIESGDYKENLFVDKKVKIVGDGAVLQPSVQYAPTVQITTGNVVLEGLKVTDSSAAIKALGAEDISVFNCTISRSDYGVSALGSKSINLVGNSFEYNRIHIMLQNIDGASIRQNKISGGSTGIMLTNSKSNNATGNTFREMNVGVALENSAKNELRNNDFKQCDAGVYSVLSNNNRFSKNEVKNTSVFLDLKLSANNKIAQNAVENCTYSRTVNSNYNFYNLENMNLSGKEFELSIIDPSIPQKYTNLSRGVDLTLNSPNSTDECQVLLQASIPVKKVLGSNLSSVGLYKLEDLEMISNKTFHEDIIEINASVNQSGKYILLAQKEDDAGNSEEGSYSNSGTTGTTEGIIMFAVVIASIVVMLYILSRGR